MKTFKCDKCNYQCTLSVQNLEKIVIPHCGFYHKGTPGWTLTEDSDKPAVTIACDHRRHSKSGRYMLYEDWCEKCGTVLPSDGNE